MQDAGTPFCLTTLFAVDGSSPRKAGTRILVFPDATIAGAIGLDPGDEPPAEIAISIMAEIIMVKSGGTARPLRALAR